MQVKPLADRVIVRPFEDQEMKKGGIIIPDTAKEKPMEGEVIEIGPGRTTEEGKRVDLEVKKGDRVLFRKYSGTEITVEEQQYLILQENEILATI